MSLVILLFLWHIPSAIVPIVTIPVSVLLAFIPMCFMGITSNIMSLAGIAISIGVLVDGAIVEVENAYKKLELWQRGGRQGRLPRRCACEALQEVGPVGLLLAARDRGRVPADLHAGRPGGPALQAARLDEEPHHGDRRAARRSRSIRRCACSSRAWTSSTSGRAGWPGSSNHGDGRPLLPRGAAPDQPRALRGLRAGLPLRAAPSARRRSRPPSLLVAHDRPRLPRASAPSSCRRSNEGTHPLHADDAARHLGHRGAAACSRSRTGSCTTFPEVERVLRQGRPRRDRRPIRRRSR